MSAYEINQLASGIKVGDRVKVLRTAIDGERGWDCHWNSRVMDGYVGSIFTVNNIDTVSGMFLNNYWFPYFVLEVVKEDDVPS